MSNVWRMCTAEDIDIFVELWWEFLEEHCEHSDRDASEKDLQAAIRMFKLFTEKRQIGEIVFYCPTGPDGAAEGVMMGGEKEDAVHDGHLGRVCHIFGLYIRPEHRKEGIGLALCHMEARLADRTESSFDTVQTTVLATNQAGHAVARAFGCKPIEVLYQRRRVDKWVGDE